MAIEIAPRKDFDWTAECGIYVCEDCHRPWYPMELDSEEYDACPECLGPCLIATKEKLAAAIAAEAAASLTVFRFEVPASVIFQVRAATQEEAECLARAICAEHVDGDDLDDTWGGDAAPRLYVGNDKGETPLELHDYFDVDTAQPPKEQL